MTYQYRLQKVMDIKENEKKKTVSEYEQSVQEFERVAEKLYECLKKKEELEKTKAEKLHQGLAVQEMRHFQQFVTNLEKTIDHYQKLVILTRDRMNEKQALLMEKNMEVKKYEKMQQKDFEQYLYTQKSDENKELDQLSIMTYSYRGI
ncbi:flagellar export protein FliJ [Bacillus sp. FJAT-47783]|uniref:flagellar export protein FliJ n=1 Tax=Bacillus sp. FJAT-47783 TaxID=2922712 RepID=UPI001FAE6C96|nr:flagellar export protein FliJ [Bacillus sp. FJAT-47783]